ncbi:unnamed protein product [Ambrosiozyma monospora]|uniref:Unnamed protein product n=1 Tax=Ambrosiozyma monospora TaxID=43982 RepID=A0ACB5SRP8_AMBMO|nr:unnamed protein product [Ambrosiozyma monospora]
MHDKEFRLPEITETVPKMTSKTMTEKNTELTEITNNIKEITDPLPNELKLHLSQYLLPADPKTVVSNITQFTDILNQTSQKFTLIFESKEDLKLESKYTGKFRLKTIPNYEHTVLSKITIKDTIMQYPSYQSHMFGCMSTTSVNPFSKKSYEAQLNHQGLNFSDITVIKVNPFPCVLPPLELVKLCDRLKYVEVGLSYVFDDYDGLFEIAELVRVVVKLNDLAQRHVDQGTVQLLRNHDNFDVIIL